MKKSAAAAGLAALTLLDISAATPASAQDASTFVGPYVGAHTGYFIGNATFESAPYTVTSPVLGNTFNFPARNDSFDFGGLIGGAHGGINVLLGPNLIGSIEGDWTNLDESDVVSASGTIRSLTNDGFSFQRRSVIDLEWQSTLRGRLGFVAGNTLFFGTAGVAFLNLDWSEKTSIQRSGGFGPTVTLTHSDSDTLVGGAVGGGFETAITPTILFGADYLYENFESFGSVPHGFISAQSGKIDDIDIHKFRVRLTFKLGGAPQ